MHFETTGFCIKIMTILSRFFSQEFTSIASQSWQQDWGRGLLSLPADVLWGSFVTHSFLKGMRDKRTLKDVCGEARGTFVARNYLTI